MLQGLCFGNLYSSLPLDKFQSLVLRVCRENFAKSCIDPWSLFEQLGRSLVGDKVGQVIRLQISQEAIRLCLATASHRSAIRTPPRRSRVSIRMSIGLFR